MSWTKIIFINLFVFFLILGFVEASYRLINVTRSCLSGNCNFRGFTTLKLDSLEEYVPPRSGLFKADDILGYVPREGFRAIVNDARSNNVQVTITPEGFRKNNEITKYTDANILAIGDSFTFGEQVSDNDTWPACLQEKLGARVDNAGVSGYGAAQSIKRAQLLVRKKRYSSVIFSIFVADDFNRDRFAYQWGDPRPAVISTDNGIRWATVDLNREGTIFNPKKVSGFAWLYDRSLLAAGVMRKFQKKFQSAMNLNGASLTLEHPQAASKAQIIAFTLKAFSELDVKAKIVLLQYDRKFEDSVNSRDRDEIVNIAKSLELRIVDTSKVFADMDTKNLWDGHHTAYGNRVVCEYLYEQAFR